MTKTTALRRLALSLPLMAACLAGQQNAHAQEWPAKPIRIVSPYAAGGVGDTILRILAPTLEARLGQRFVIDNRTGAAGNIGTAEVVNAAPDGYTFLLAPTANYAVNPYLFKLSFDPLTQLEPVAALANAPLIAVVGGTVPVTSMKELAARIKTDSGKFNYGSPGAGSPTHLAGASFAMAYGTRMEHIPFRGTPPMVQGMLANDIQMAFPTLAAVAGFLPSGKLKALAVLSTQRLPELPNVPTAAEAGFPEMVFGNWWVMSAPRGTDPKVIAKLSGEIRAVLADPAVKTRLAEIGHLPMGTTPAETSAFVRAEAANYKALIERTGIRID